MTTSATRRVRYSSGGTYDSRTQSYLGGTKRWRQYQRLFSFANYEGSDYTNSHDHPISVYQQGDGNELTILWGECCGSSTYKARYKTMAGYYPLSAGAWNHMVVSFAGLSYTYTSGTSTVSSASGVPTLYINGVTYPLEVVVGPPMAAIPVATRQHMWIGKGLDSGYDSSSKNAHFKGVVRSFFIYRTAFSYSDAYGHYQFMSQVPPPPENYYYGTTTNLGGKHPSLFQTDLNANASSIRNFPDFERKLREQINTHGIRGLDLDSDLF